MQNNTFICKVYYCCILIIINNFFKFKVSLMIIKGFTDLFSKLRKYDFVKCLTLSEYSSLPEIIITLNFFLIQILIFLKL